MDSMAVADPRLLRVVVAVVVDQAEQVVLTTEIMVVAVAQVFLL
jgi:hypothetical protein